MRDKLKALRIGVDDYLTKPFEEEELLARVANLLKNQEEKRAWLQTLKKPKGEAAEEKSQASSLSEEDLEWLKNLEALVEAEQGDSTFNVERLTELLFLSRRQLQRRIKQFTGLSPNQYIQEARLQTARQTRDLWPNGQCRAWCRQPGWCAGRQARGPAGAPAAICRAGPWRRSAIATNASRGIARRYRSLR